MTVRTTGISMNPEISSTRSTSSRAEAMPIAVAFLVLVFGFSGIAQAATIPFSYIINGGSLTTGLPPTLSETFTGSGVVNTLRSCDIFGFWNPHGRPIFSRGIWADGIRCYLCPVVQRRS